MLAATALVLGAGGCERRFFRATGYVASQGGVLSNWRSTPMGCSRDPLDGLPRGRSQTIAMFVWEDPSMHDPNRDQDRAWAPDAPLRLELAHDGAGYVATVRTVKTGGTDIKSAACRTFEVDTTEERPSVAGALPGLGGRVRMDCEAGGSHVTAEFRFSRCEF